MTEEERYAEAWRNKARRGLVAVGVGLGGTIVLITPMALLDTPHLEQFAPVILIGFGIWFVAVIASVIYGHRFKCPRCGNYFYSNGRGIWLPSYCTHCGLPSNSPPTSAVAPEFTKGYHLR